MAYFTYKKLFFLPVLMLGFFASEAKDSGLERKAAIVGSFNYAHFTTPKAEGASNLWLSKNQQFTRHPDAPYQAGNDGLIELFEKRTERSKYYTKASDPRSFVIDNATSPLHYKKNGQWLNIDAHLAPKAIGTFEASRQTEPVGFSTANKLSYIKTNLGKISFNNWELLGEDNGQYHILAKADWSQLTAGDDGIFIRNIFSGIDAEMHVRRGEIETNFILHQNNFAGYRTLALRDVFSDNSNGSLDFSGTSSFAPQVGEVGYFIKGKKALNIGKAITYTMHNPSNGIQDLKYSVNNNKLSILFDAVYLDAQLAFGDVIIDPKVVTVGTLAQASITGSMNCGSASNYCSYDLSITPPANASITKVYDRFSLFVTAPATVGQSVFAIAVNGGCVATYAIPANVQTNIAFGTKDTASNAIGFDSLTNFVRPCLPAPSCNPTPIIFQLRLYNTYCIAGPTGCSNVYNSANESFVIRIEGYTFAPTVLTRTSNVSICPGTSVTLSRSGNFGVLPYRYLWTPTGDTTPTITVSPAVTTLYTSTITDGCNNVYTDTTTVIVIANPTAPIIVANPVRICQFDAPRSLASSITGTNLRYYPTATGGTSSPIAPIPPTNVPGTYNYYVTQVNSCNVESVRLKITVIVNPKPAPPGVTTPLRLCQYDTVALSADGQNVRWYLNPVGGGGQSPFFPPTGGINDSTFYYATQTVAGCESDRSRLLVTVTYKPNGIITPNRIVLCQNESDSFYYYGNARPDAVYNWTSPHPQTAEVSGAGTQGPYVVRFDSAGTYYVSVQVNNRGCLSDIARQPITVRPAPALTFSGKEDACVDEVIRVALSQITTGIDSFDYDFGGASVKYGAGSGGPYGIVFSTPGEKTITNTAFHKGCPSRVTPYTINVHPLPDARFTITTSSGGGVLCTGDSLTLTARNTDSNTHFVWTPDNFFESGNVYTAKGFLSKSGYISLTETSEFGCRAADSILVKTETCCQVYFPNAFSPNGDTHNELFRPVSRGNHEVKSFRVLNRWGQVVYESQDEKRGWDGVYNGKAQDAGTYYYVFIYKCGQGGGDATKEELKEKGEFLLIR